MKTEKSRKDSFISDYSVQVAQYVETNNEVEDLEKKDEEVDEEKKDEVELQV